MTQRRQRNKRWIYWVIILVLLIITITVVCLVKNNYFGNDEQSAVEEASVEADSEKDEKSITEQTAEKDDDAQTRETEDTKKIKQYDGSDPNESATLTGAITYAGVAGNDLMVRVNIDQYLDGGECVLNLSKNGGIVYSETVRTITAATTTTCEGFNVATSKLGSGRMNISIKISAGEKKGEINGEVEI